MAKNFRTIDDGRDADGFIVPGYNAWDCDRCGREVRRFRGSRSAECHDCGAQYSPSGQRYRDDWRNNRSNWDSEVGDMEGYEMAGASDA